MVLGGEDPGVEDEAAPLVPSDEDDGTPLGERAVDVEQVASLLPEGPPESGKAPTVQRVGAEEELLPPQRDGPDTGPSLLPRGVPTGPRLGLLEEEALQSQEGGYLEVVTTAGRARPLEDGGAPAERPLRMVRADPERSAQVYGGPDAREPPAERLRGLEPPLAAGAEPGRGLEVLR